MLKSVPYHPPSWASQLRHPPARKLHLGQYPTPIHAFSPPGLPDGVQLYLKRDDFGGLEASGNKIRPLEFLLQAALDHGADCIVTMGAVHSNHCRVAAMLARMLGMDAYLVLIAGDPDKNPGLVGNMMFDRLVGAKLIQLSFEEFLTIGGDKVLDRVCDDLRRQGKRPYVIPGGGSSGLGAWGYLTAVDEINEQVEALNLDVSDMACACGSGCTAAGLGIGVALSAANDPRAAFHFDGGKSPMHAYNVGFDNETFFKHVDQDLLPAMGAPDTLRSREILQITAAQGLGYGQNTPEEVQFIADVARTTGVVMDPVFSGKALYHLIRELNETPEKFVGRSILFVHTGGQFGIYDKAPELQHLCDENPATRFKVENGDGK